MADPAVRPEGSVRRNGFDLSAFDGHGYDKGRPVWQQALWYAVSELVFQAWWLPARCRPPLLRAFGARIGPGVFIRARVRVHWPWKLEIGAGSWVGEGVWLLDLEPITVGANVCLSQEALLCTGSHDRHSPDFAFANRPVRVEDGAWVATRATVLAGATVTAGAVVPAGTVVPEGRRWPLEDAA